MLWYMYFSFFFAVAIVLFLCFFSTMIGELKIIIACMGL